MATANKDVKPTGLPVGIGKGFIVTKRPAAVRPSSTKGVRSLKERVERLAYCSDSRILANRWPTAKINFNAPRL